MYNAPFQGGTENNPIPLISSIVPPIPSPARKNCRLLRPLYSATKALRTLILDTSDTSQHFQFQYIGGVHGKGALCLSVPAGRSGQGRQTKAEIRTKSALPSWTPSSKSSYESFAVGRITDERLDSLLRDYEAEQKTLQASCHRAEERLSAFAGGQYPCGAGFWSWGKEVHGFLRADHAHDQRVY